MKDKSFPLPKRSFNASFRISVEAEAPIALLRFVGLRIRSFQDVYPIRKDQLHSTPGLLELVHSYSI